MTSHPTPLQVLLAAPRGFCAGVDRAIEIVELALRQYGPPVYVRHAIVHNTHVVADLEAKGAVFVEDEDDVPEGGLIVFSAHGVAPQVRRNAEQRALRPIDATCPLVTKVHLEARDYARLGYSIVLIGHAGHQEVIGTTGEAPEAIMLVESVEDVSALDLPDPERIAYITQTTLSVDEAAGIVDALKARYPNARGPRGEDICYATTNRQAATKELAARAEVVLVVGSAHSSNSQRMVEVALAAGADAAHLIEDAGAVDEAWLDGVRTVGLTSGASAPESLVTGVIWYLRDRPGGAQVTTVDVLEEHMSFALPAGLRRLPVQSAR
ncbi:MAG: 4-hydroxy-3-methylbut-2-enyl diphosphate reductase [Nitriliruptorales bacterium]|nr:4-hydroxy-3-methylbut-2-enyl diphosphate reductase [Nitriliruptorales bacterium]